MSLKSSLSFIVNHPLNSHQKVKAVFRFFQWQIFSRLFNPKLIHKFTPKVKLIVKKGMTGATGNLYCGLHEFNDMGFLLHFLRPEDHFMDIGANIGSYTLLAAGHVGATTTTFEPVPGTFKSLEDNIVLNNLNEKVTLYNCAVGAKEGMLKFTDDQDTMNHIATSDDDNVFEVEVKSLENLVGEDNVPTLIKIDVEGFETEVINGSENILAQKVLKAIIIELNGSGERYGYDESKIHERLLNKGFQSYTYSPIKRTLSPVERSKGGNTIYIRDIDFAKERIRKANKIQLFSREF